MQNMQSDCERSALEIAREVGEVPGGQFLSRTYSNEAGTRGYKLYIPRGHRNQPAPLLVMLHGCKQTPDDFAAGTRMNELADRHGFLVLYPAQAALANGMRCWNWFNERHQVRDRGEPLLIAGLTREVAREFHVDEQRIFAAGLSAGAAMAVILGATYPDLFAAVGAHSGLPFGAANSVTSALAAMRGSNTSRAGVSSLPGRVQNQLTSGVHLLTPTIVFHGDNDSRVNAINGSETVDQALALASGGDAPLRKTQHERACANGREYTTTTYRDARKHLIIENWVLHGGGHAWSGGSSKGSYADETGPDASAEMLRFFFAQKKRA